MAISRLVDDELGIGKAPDQLAVDPNKPLPCAGRPIVEARRIQSNLQNITFSIPSPVFQTQNLEMPLENRPFFKEPDGFSEETPWNRTVQRLFNTGRACRQGTEACRIGFKHLDPRPQLPELVGVDPAISTNVDHSVMVSNDQPKEFRLLLERAPKPTVPVLRRNLTPLRQHVPGKSLQSIVHRSDIFADNLILLNPEIPRDVTVPPGRNSFLHRAYAAPDRRASQLFLRSRDRGNEFVCRHARPTCLIGNAFIT